MKHQSTKKIHFQSRRKSQMWKKNKKNTFFGIISNCHSCKTLQLIEEKHVARLQHHFKFEMHFKFCDVYSVYYRRIKILAAIIQFPERIHPEMHFLHQEQVKEIWTFYSFIVPSFIFQKVIDRRFFS